MVSADGMRVHAVQMSSVQMRAGMAMPAEGATAPATTLERIDLAMHVLLIIVLPVRMRSDRRARHVADSRGHRVRRMRE